MQTKYVISDTDLLLDIPISEKKYVLKVRDLPSQDKPREKLIELGPAALTIHELLAVVLGTGTKKEGVLEMSHRILKEYGERILSHQTNPTTVAKELNIPLTKAEQIVACAELGRRFFSHNPHIQATIRTARDVFNYAQDMRTLQKEHVRGIYLNSHHKVIHDEVISIGTVNANLIHPREVFRPALEYGAAAVILVHNHPSGIVTPSAPDIEVTKQLVEAGRIMGIKIIDHVIIGRDSFISISVDY